MREGSRNALCVCGRETGPQKAVPDELLTQLELLRKIEEEERKREEEDRRLAEELWRKEEEEERERKKKREWEETLTLVRTQAKAESDEELGTLLYVIVHTIHSI